MSEGHPGISKLFLWNQCSVAASINLHFYSWRPATRCSGSFYWQTDRKLKPGLPLLVFCVFMRGKNAKRLRQTKACISLFWRPQLGQQRGKLTHTWLKCQAAKPILALDNSTSLIIRVGLNISRRSAHCEPWRWSEVSEHSLYRQPVTGSSCNNFSYYHVQNMMSVMKCDVHHINTRARATTVQIKIRRAAAAAGQTSAVIWEEFAQNPFTAAGGNYCSRFSHIFSR